MYRSLPLGQLRAGCWAAQSDICLLQEQRLVLLAPSAAASSSIVTLATAEGNGQASRPEQHWRMYRLLDVAESEYVSAAAQPNPSVTQLTISPCGMVVVGLATQRSHEPRTQQDTDMPVWQLQHWYLGGKALHGNEIYPTLLNSCTSHATIMRQLVWHPQPRGCIYAVYDQYSQKVLLVDAKASQLMRSWTAAELFEQTDEVAEMEHDAPALTGPDDKQHGNACEWSHDGGKLAICLNGLCTVLNFAGSC